MTKQARGIGLLLLVALVGCVLLNIWLGEAEVARVATPQIVGRVLLHHLPGLSSLVAPVPDNLEALVWEIRLPRVVGGVLIGMLLALAGVAFQSLLSNPLADPYMVGVSAGSALGSVVVILLGGAGLLAGFAQPLAAFVTGLLAMVLVSLLASREGRLSTQAFLLAGIVVGTFLWSLIPLMLSLANRAGNLDRQGAILAQLLGTLTFLGWDKVLTLLPFGLLGGFTLWRSAPELNLMAMGEESAAHLGVDIEAFKRRVILAGALTTAAAVSVAGIVAFVGLVVPHIARRLVGPDHRGLLPVAMLLGGLVLLTADLLSRVWLANLEVGVITSLLGAPVFCYLLRRQVIGR